MPSSSPLIGQHKLFSTIPRLWLVERQCCTVQSLHATIKQWMNIKCSLTSGILFLIYSAFSDFKFKIDSLFNCFKYSIIFTSYNAQCCSLCFMKMTSPFMRNEEHCEAEGFKIMKKVTNMQACNSSFVSSSFRNILSRL